MKEIILRLKEVPPFSIEAEVIRPETLAGKGPEEIEALEVWVWNKKLRLSEFFEVEGRAEKNPTKLRVKLIGGEALKKVKRIGQEMSSGEVVVEGWAGMHLGSKMRGGRIIVKGNASSWIGMEMSGGEILIEGDAGSYVGAAYRGYWVGMTGGKILIKGCAKDFVGSRMSGGEIEVFGDVRDFLGCGMTGGRITVRGSAGRRTGLWMTGGEIVVHKKPLELLPSFRLVGEEGGFRVYVGDLEEDGKGKLIVRG